MKLGFIDYYLDEWHANNYPAWIAEASDGRMAVTHAYGQIDSPRGVSSRAWCDRHGVRLCGAIEEVVAACDGLIVLSPDNPEQHLQLCGLPLKSGKPTYVDKTFAPDLDTARRIFAIADAHGTPCYSTSALRYASEYADVDRAAIQALRSFGPGSFDIYSIHQIEPVCMLMPAQPARVMCLTSGEAVAMNVQFRDGRYATIDNHPKAPGFRMDVLTRDGVQALAVESAFFQAFIKAMVGFFEEGSTPLVDHRETLRVMALREAGIRALAAPGTWLDVPEA